MATAPDQSTLARKWKFLINTGTVAVPVWTTVKGLAELKFQQFEPTLKDDNVYEDSGYTSKTKTALSWSAEAKLVRRRSPSDVTSYDTGQERLKAQAALFGPAGVAHVRIYDRDGSAEAYEGFGEIGWKNEGGSMDDLERVTVSLDGKGALTVITNPEAVPVPAPTVTAVTPTALATAGGQTVKITGTNFVAVTGAGGVKFGVTNAAAYFVQDSTTIYATSPAKTAATYDITVVSATGTSATSAADQVTYS